MSRWGVSWAQKQVVRQQVLSVSWSSREPRGPKPEAEPEMWRGLGEDGRCCSQVWRPDISTAGLLLPPQF